MRLNSRTVRAIAIGPGHRSPEMVARPDPLSAADEVLVEGLLVGVCATDLHVIEHAGALAEPLVLGHESLGRVATAPPNSGFAVDDLVVGLVRRPCPERCANCCAGELDRCRTRPPVERGISRADGFAAEWWTSQPQFLCPVPAALGEAGVLIEPMSSVMKGLRRVGHREDVCSPSTALVLGAGTIGVLASAALVQLGFDVDVVDPYVDRHRGELVAALGGRLLPGPAPTRQYDLAVEASGSDTGLGQCFEAVGANGDVLVLGLPPVGATAITSVAQLVMDNVQTVFSVSATAADHRRAASSLGDIDAGLLASMIAREYPLARYPDAILPGVGQPPKTIVRVTA